MRPTAHRNLTVCVLCSLILLCFSGKLALALDPTRDLSQFNAQVWLTENGLPQNTVHSIAQARDGYVWIATEEGLARFDGIRFTVFDKQNTPELKTNDIRVLLEDRQGALWIGTTDGLVRLSEAKFTAFTTRDGLPSNVIDALCEGYDGSLWVATAAGIARFAGNVFTARSEFPGNGVRALFADREGSLWIGSSEGLARYKNGAVAK